MFLVGQRHILPLFNLNTENRIAPTTKKGVLVFLQSSDESKRKFIVLQRALKHIRFLGDRFFNTKPKEQWLRYKM